MRPIVHTAMACLSMAAFSQAVNAQVSRSVSGVTLEEVVVTAQKREERLQDVPISISVLGGEALDESTDRGVTEALSRVPSVFAPLTSNGARTGGNPAIAIRGVSAATVGPSTTAYYLDSTPFGRAHYSFVPDSNPYDLDRVEVLRGPQGTLYGASALNGVVRILTKNPNLKDFEFKARASLAGTDHGSESYTGDAAFNIPLIQDRLAARIVAGYQNLGGWIDKPLLSEKDANDTEKSNVRVKVAARLTDNFTVGLNGWFSRTDSAPPFSNDGGRTSSASIKEPSKTDFDSYALDLKYDTSVVSIRSATSYLDYTLDNRFDLSAYTQVPGTMQVSKGGSTVFTEELVLNSVGSGPWRWTLGSMYRDAQDNDNGGTNLGTPPDIVHVESKSLAVFGEVTRVFADGRFELTGGLRYFRDKVRDWEDSRSSAGPTGIPTGGLSPPIENTFTKTTPRVVLSWHPSKDAMLYASYAKGFRSGLNQGFVVAEAYPDLPPTKPDTINNYELGTKVSTLSGRLTFDTALYYIDWQDVQQDSAVFIPGNPIAQPASVNGKSLSGVGVDLAVMYAPIDSLMLGLNFGWNDLKYDHAVIDPADPTLQRIEFPKGSRRSNSPETTAGANIAYTVALGSSGYRGRLSASANYVAEQITGARANTTGGFPPVTTSYTLLKADSMTLVRVGFTIDAPKHWNATLYVDNATNEEGVQPDPFSSGFDVVIRPRTYGLQFEYKL